MPKATSTIKVAPIQGEALRYYVESWTSPQRPHVVDLGAYGGAGECSCKDWQTRRGPIVKAGAKPGAPGSLCKHVMAARTHFTNHMLADLSAEINKHRPQHEHRPSSTTH